MKTQTRQLTEHVYHQLHERLAERELQIGEHLKSHDVAVELGVSQATARTAIGRLVKAGLLDTGDNGRPVVVKHPPRRKRRIPREATFHSLTEETAERILDMGLNRRFQPGEVIKARPLAQELKVSLATARAALDLLCRDGIFNRLFRRGWQMPPLKLEEVRTMFSIRRTLEAMVLDRLFQRIEDFTLDSAALGGLLTETQEMIASFDETSRVERMRAEHRFHQQLIALAGDQVLAEVLQPLLSKMMLLVNVTHGLSRSSFPEHQRILKAIKQRNKAEALAALERDLADPLEVAFYDWD